MKTLAATKHRRKRGRPRGGAPEEVRLRVLTSLKQSLAAGRDISLSVDDIASGLRISKKTLYKVFSSKEDLVRQLLDQLMAEIGGRVEEIVGADERVPRKLSQLLSFLSLELRRMDSNLGRELHFRMPELWKRVEHFRERKLQENITKLLDQGVREGVIRPDIDRQLFLMAFIATAQAVIKPSTLLIDHWSPQQVVSQFITMMYAGIMTDAGRTEFFAATRQSTSA